MDSIEDLSNARANYSALDRLPESLDNTYEDIVARRRNSSSLHSSALAEKVLSWTCYAESPLSLAELQHAVAIEDGDTKFEPTVVRFRVKIYL